MTQRQDASFNVDNWLVPKYLNDGPKILSKELANQSADAVFFYSEKMHREVRIYGYEMRAWALMLEADPAVASYNEAPPDCGILKGDVKTYLKPDIVIVGRDRSITAIRVGTSSDFSKNEKLHATHFDVLLKKAPAVDKKKHSRFIENTFKMLRHIEIHSPRLRPDEGRSVIDFIKSQNEKTLTLGAMSRQITWIPSPRVISVIADLIFQDLLVADLRGAAFDGAMAIKASDVSPTLQTPRLSYFD